MKILANDDGTYTCYASEKELVAMRVSAEYCLEHSQADVEGYKARLELKGLCANIKNAIKEAMK